MSKNELRVIARIMLIGVGLYVLLQTFLTLFSHLTIMLFVATPSDVKTSLIIGSISIYIVMAVGAVYFLIRCANRISAKIVESDTVDDTQVFWLAATFRLVCVSAGVMFLYWSLPRLIVTLSLYMSAKPGQIYTSKETIIEYVVLLALSIYFAFGAPGFVRWQVRRTLKQCGKIEEQQPTSH